MLKFSNDIFQKANNKGTDQTEQMRSLFSAFGILMQQNQVFSWQVQFITVLMRWVPIQDILLLKWKTMVRRMGYGRNVGVGGEVIE